MVLLEILRCQYATVPIIIYLISRLAQLVPMPIGIGKSTHSFIRIFLFDFDEFQVKSHILVREIWKVAPNGIRRGVAEWYSALLHMSDFTIWFYF